MAHRDVSGVRDHVCHWGISGLIPDNPVGRILTQGRLPIGSRCRCRSSPPIFGKTLQV
jgi:hypothetical protein